MKRVVILVVAVVLTANFAQAQFSFGVRAGVNFTKFSETSQGLSWTEQMEEKSKLKPGFQIGVVGEYAINENFVIQPGIIFSQQGCRYKVTSTVQDKKATAKTVFNLNYIQIPVIAQYKIDLADKKLLLNAGPYFGYGIGGKLKMKTTVDGKTEKKSESFKFLDDDKEGRMLLNPTDFGLCLGVGLQLNNIQAGIGYNFGLVALQDDVDQAYWKNNGLAFTATLFFGK